MRLAATVSKLSRESCVRCRLKSEACQLPALITQNQPWKRGYATAIGEKEASAFKVKVTSREMIKPSSLAPHHNKSVYLSLIDQIASSSYNPILLFYGNDYPTKSTNKVQTSMLLKKALSETLVDFYPLAGRIKNNEIIECSNEGAEFCEAHASTNITQIIENHNIHELEALMPFQGTPRHKNIVLSIQVNHFTCGGLAVGVCLSHKIADGAATLSFLNAWATKALGVDLHRFIPKFDGASLFPPLKELNHPILIPENHPIDRIAMKRLIFDKKCIGELKVQAAKGGTVICPTSVEVVTAFIWNHLPRSLSTVVHLVNLRTRMVPPVPEDYFGNLAWVTRTSPMTLSASPNDLVTELRKAITKVNNDYIQQFFFSDDDFLSKLTKEAADVLEASPNLISFTSLCRFPLYQVDFGMGKPIWACFPFPLASKGIVFWSTKCGQGIEAWIYLPEDDITMLNRQLDHSRL